MFQTPTRKGFSVTPKVNFHKNKEKMSAPNNATYHVNESTPGLPNSVIFPVDLTGEVDKILLQFQTDTWKVFDLFGTANTWTADQTFDSEVKGTKHSILFSHNGNITSSTFLKIGEVLIDKNKQPIMIRPGSVVGVSINYDVTAASGNPTTTIEVFKNNMSAWSNGINSDVANDKQAQFTQARDTDTFIAGDSLGVQLKVVGIGATITIKEVIVMLEFYYDD